MTYNRNRDTASDIQRLMRGYAWLLLLANCVGDETSNVNDAGKDASTDNATTSDVSADTNPCVDTQNDPKNCGTCGHDCVGGLCTAGVCQVATLITGQAAVTALVPTATKLYWARAMSGAQHGGVFSSDLDGQNQATIYDAGANNSCFTLDIDGTSAAYFYCAGEFYTCTLPTCGGSPTPLLAQAMVSATALDSTNRALYFTVYTPYNQQTGGFIASMPLTGGSYTRLVAADQPSPAAVLIHAGMVYWLNSGTYMNDNIVGNGGVRSAPLGSNQTATDLVNDKTAIDYAGLALQGSTIYYGVGSGNAIHSVATIGGSASTYVASGFGEITSLVADSSAVYWAESQANTVYKCQLGSCASKTTLASGQNAPGAMAQDAASVYWANYSGGEIRRLAK